MDFDDQLIIVMDTSNGFWFLPGGGVEQNESIEETAKREAAEELGLEIKINQIVRVYHVTLVSRQTRDQIKIPPFIAVHATPLGGQLKKEYASNRKIVLIKKKHCKSLLHDFEIPREYQCMKPYHYISKEVVRQLVTR